MEKKPVKVTVEDLPKKAGWTDKQREEQKESLKKGGKDGGFKTL